MHTGITVRRACRTRCPGPAQGRRVDSALPNSNAVQQVTDRQFFAIDYTFFLNLAFGLISAVFVVWKARTMGFDSGSSSRWSEKILYVLALAAFGWLAAGLVAPMLLV